MVEEPPRPGSAGDPAVTQEVTPHQPPQPRAVDAAPPASDGTGPADATASAPTTTDAATDTVTAAPAARRWDRRGLWSLAERQAATLFVAASARPVTWRSWALAAAAVVVGALAGLYRQPGVGALDTMWAEDGKIFLGDATSKSFLDAMATSYNGYYQALPRLLAEPASLLPASWAAPFFALESAVLTALFGVLIYIASGAHLRSRLARFVSAAFAVVPPLAMQDLPNSLCNLHWPGLYALFWVLLWVPSGRAGRVIGVALAAVIAATNILALVLVPLALVRGVFGRDRYSKLLGLLVSGGVALHLIGLLAGAASRQTHLGVYEPLKQYVMRVVPPALLGEMRLGVITDPRLHRWTVAAVAWLIVLAVVIVALARLSRPNWRVAALAGLHSLVFWLAAAGSTGLIATRYAATSAMFLVGGLVALLIPVARGRWRLAGLAVFTVLLAVVCAENLRVDNLRAKGPRWSDAVAAAAQECRDTGRSTADLRIAPLGEPAWFVRLPCSYLTGAG